MVVSPCQRHHHRHFSLRGFPMHNKESDGYGPVCQPFLPRGTRYLSMILHRPGRAVPSNATIGLPSMVYFFRVNRISAGINVSILCRASHIHAFRTVDQRPTFSPLPGYGFLRPTDWLQQFYRHIHHPFHTIPFFRMRFTSACVFAFQVPCTGSPFTFKVAFSHQSGTRRNKENAFFFDGFRLRFTVSFTAPSHGYSVSCTSPIFPVSFKVGKANHSLIQIAIYTHSGHHISIVKTTNGAQRRRTTEAADILGTFFEPGRSVYGKSALMRS